MFINDKKYRYFILELGLYVIHVMFILKHTRYTTVKLMSFDVKKT